MVLIWGKYKISSAAHAIKDQREILRTTLDIDNNAKTCEGAIDEVSKIDGDSQYLKLKGWIFDSMKNEVPEYGLIVNEFGAVHGIVLTGVKRINIANTINEKALYSGMEGYIFYASKFDKLKIYNPDSNCLLPIIQ